MTSKEEKLSRLRAYNASLRGEDDAIEEEEALEVSMPTERALALESIIMRRRRPVLAIQDGTTTLEFRDPADGAIWKSLLEKAKAVLEPAIAAVGRIDLQGNPDYLWVGTGWLVHEHIAVTNRHVAELFAERDGNGFVFQPGVDGAMSAAIDFLHELERQATAAFEVKGVLHIEPRSGLDLAFLEVDQTGGRLAKPIVLSSRKLGPNPMVATVGYPAQDSRIPEPALMEEIYGKVYDLKRLAPGAITEVDERRLLHNCTTLGGNSGSVIVDLTNGEALGLHFSGSFMRTNYAVRGELVQERLDALLAGRVSGNVERSRRSSVQRTVNGRRGVEPAVMTRSASTATSLNLTIPLTVTVSLGEPTAASAPAPTLPRRAPSAFTTDDDEETEIEAKTKPEDYDDRDGYKAEFLGEDFAVDLPRIVKNTNDVVTFNGGEHVLKYEHFSVVVNRRRRMCFYSACNIDGARSKSVERRAWRFDPRIPTELQIMKECYGHPPRFSRGHMTRREDPAWGTPTERQRGSDDSMHVTNVTPQMQTFNSPIWLALEDYALQHARKDDMKISFFTGPFFSAQDPQMFGVDIPVRFWKVIAFIHDEIGSRCATGYEMSQEDNLEEPEFIFGDFRSPQLNISTQVSIASIESRAGLSFDGLADVDPLGQEGLEEASRPLTRFEQIRFV